MPLLAAASYADWTCAGSQSPLPIFSAKPSMPEECANTTSLFQVDGVKLYVLPIIWCANTNLVVLVGADDSLDEVTLIESRTTTGRGEADEKHSKRTYRCHARIVGARSSLAFKGVSKMGYWPANCPMSGLKDYQLQDRPDILVVDKMVECNERCRKFFILLHTYGDSTATVRRHIMAHNGISNGTMNSSLCLRNLPVTGVRHTCHEI